MALSLLTNVQSLNAQRNLMGTQRKLNRSIARLSSGMRINRAGDDAAGLAISENLKAQIRSARQAERNANDGISLIQTAEGAMNEIQGILGRMRELAMQAASDTVGNTERGYLNKEFTALRDEIDRISKVTEYNGQKLLDGGGGSTVTLDFQVGIRNSADDRLTLSIDKMDSSTIGARDATGALTTALNAATVNLSSKANAQGALAVIDGAINDVSNARADLGALQNRMQVTITNLANFRENLSAANSRIRDTDVAEETAAMTRANILMQSGIAVLAQANQLPSMALNLLG